MNITGDQPQTLTLGYSPCPNDTFIFYALVHRKVGAEIPEVKELLLDVETLNQMALHAELDVTKVSFHAYGFLREHYTLLSSGSAIGRGCGPLVVARDRTTMEELRGKTIAIPGRLTTAYLLLQLYDPALAKKSVAMPFDMIMSAVKDGTVDAGLIIHESRFTYQEYSLSRIIDLGEWWEGDTGLPLPLGCIVARKSLGTELIEKLDKAVRKSIEYAFSHREETGGYIKGHAQELADAVIEQHINLYVNDYSLALGEEGLRAVDELLKRAEDHAIIPRSRPSL